MEIISVLQRDRSLAFGKKWRNLTLEDSGSCHLVLMNPDNTELNGGPFPFHPSLSPPPFKFWCFSATSISNVFLVLVKYSDFLLQEVSKTWSLSNTKEFLLHSCKKKHDWRHTHTAGQKGNKSSQDPVRLWTNVQCQTQIFPKISGDLSCIRSLSI